MKFMANNQVKRLHCVGIDGQALRAAAATLATPASGRRDEA
jgi:hypothetical protein